MTFAEFAKLIRFNVNANSSGFLDEDILMLANTWKDDMTIKILQANENYFGQPYTTNLVADQRQYSFDVTLANQIKFVQAKLDGVNWKLLRERDLNLIQSPVDETSILTAYKNRDPEYAIYNQQLWIFSDTGIVAVAGGLQIYGFSWPAKFTDLTSTVEMATNTDATTHGWPRGFQELLARKVQIAYKTSRDRPIALSESEKNWDQDLFVALSAIQNQNLDRSVLAQVPDTDETGEEV